MLSQFCIHIAKTTDRNEIIAVLGNALKKVCIDRFMIHMINQDDVIYSYQTAESASEKDRGNNFLITGSLAKIVLKTLAPVLFTREEVLKQPGIIGMDDFLLSFMDNA